MSLSICALFRNEAPYLREWIEFHRLVGVERFCLYQNLSEDGWQEVLQPYLEKGIVELTDWPRPSPCQLDAYRHFLDRARSQPGWVAFIDCDEFLFSPVFATIQEALQNVPPQWGAVGVNWLCFGASGRECQEVGLVTERFTLRPADNFGCNLHIKSIVRLDRAVSVGPDPHHFEVHGGTCDESGEAVTGPFTKRPSHRWLRVHHYVTKSRQEFLRRISGGRADVPTRRDPSEFEQYQAADVCDQTIWKFLTELKARLIRVEKAALVPDS